MARRRRHVVTLALATLFAAGNSIPLAIAGPVPTGTWGGRSGFIGVRLPQEQLSTIRLSLTAPAATVTATGPDGGIARCAEREGNVHLALSVRGGARRVAVLQAASRRHRQGRRWAARRDRAPPGPSCGCVSGPRARSSRPSGGRSSETLADSSSLRTSSEADQPGLRALDVRDRRRRKRGGGAAEGEAREAPKRGPAGPRLHMRMRGLEPPRPERHTDLNRARLPIPPHPRAGDSSRRHGYWHAARKPPPPIDVTTTMIRVSGLLCALALCCLPAARGTADLLPPVGATSEVVVTLASPPLAGRTGAARPRGPGGRRSRPGTVRRRAAGDDPGRPDPLALPHRPQRRRGRRPGCSRATARARCPV